VLVTPVIATLHPEQIARDFVSWLSGWLGESSALDWVFVAAASSIVYFLRQSVVAANRVGPVEVELLDCDEQDAQVHALTATLRERLASSGLPAPAGVPGGAPQARLVKVVEASPLPQAGFVAKALEALPIPEPLQYKLSGTHFKKDGRAGISYWLRPSGLGQPRMNTLIRDDDLQVVRATAFEVYSFISTQAVQAFPDWARWHSARSLGSYENALGECQEGSYPDALRLLGEARAEEPANALVALQLANVSEKLATGEAPRDRAGEAGDLERGQARELAGALGGYLVVASRWPWLVQPRYRASVIAGVLTGMCTRPGPAGEGARRGVEEGPFGTCSVTDVERIAKSQSDAVLQLLKPWYVLLRWGRLRSQFEPSAEERRQLKRAVGISRHCVRLRSLGAENGLWDWLSVQHSRLAVHCWHLFFGVIKLDWQTHYIAACFDALLLVRLNLIEAAERQISADPPTVARASRRGDSRHNSNGWRNRFRVGSRRRLQREAFVHLRHAINDTGQALPSMWILEEDPDLEILRTRYARKWGDVTAQLAALQAIGREPETRDTETREEPDAAPAEEMRGGVAAREPREPTASESFPVWPWPAPWRRAGAWGFVALLFLAGLLADAAFSLTDTIVPWIAALVVLVAFCSWRTALAIREARLATRMMRPKRASVS
jgi:hypothetical protein